MNNERTKKCLRIASELKITRRSKSQMMLDCPIKRKVGKIAVVGSRWNSLAVEEAFGHNSNPKIG